VDIINLFVSVPIACFRAPHAREYFETFPCPPPSTVYGMLLSAVGEINRRTHEGAEIAIAMLSEPQNSVVLRTVWRVKTRNEPPGLGTNRRPDFQELLTDVRIAIWLRRGQDCSPISLVERLQSALTKPSAITRFGGLSLGESTHLVDEISLFNQIDKHGRMLVGEEDGDLSLPVWPDHVGAKTRWGQYRLVNCDLTQGPPSEAWTIIQRP